MDLTKTITLRGSMWSDAVIRQTTILLRSYLTSFATFNKACLAYTGLSYRLDDGKSSNVKSRCKTFPSRLIDTSKRSGITHLLTRLTIHLRLHLTSNTKQVALLSQTGRATRMGGARGVAGGAAAPLCPCPCPPSCPPRQNVGVAKVPCGC